MKNERPMSVHAMLQRVGSSKTEKLLNLSRGRPDSCRSTLIAVGKCMGLEVSGTPYACPLKWQNNDFLSPNKVE